MIVMGIMIMKGFVLRLMAWCLRAGAIGVLFTAQKIASTQFNRFIIVLRRLFILASMFARARRQQRDVPGSWLR